MPSKTALGPGTRRVYRNKYTLESLETHRRGSFILLGRRVGTGGQTHGERCQPLGVSTIFSSVFVVRGETPDPPLGASHLHIRGGWCCSRATAFGGVRYLLGVPGGDRPRVIGAIFVCASHEALLMHLSNRRPLREVPLVSFAFLCPILGSLGRIGRGGRSGVLEKLAGDKRGRKWQPSYEDEHVRFWRARPRK